LLLLAVLFPIAVYLGILGWINRRPHGMLVRGPWDFAGILLAGSGFILFGGPALLSSLIQTENWRALWLAGIFRNMADPLALGRVILFAGYFVVIVLVSALVLRQRRRFTSIYNVHPSLVERVLGETFRRWGLSFVQTGNVLLIEPVQAQEAEEAAAPPSVLVERVTTLEVEASLGMCHVTLSWDPHDTLLRREVENQLRHALAQEPGPGGAVGDWFLLAASLLFLLIVLGLGLIVFLMARAGRI
jgi:hypothetical protein